MPWQGVRVRVPLIMAGSTHTAGVHGREYSLNTTSRWWDRWCAAGEERLRGGEGPQVRDALRLYISD